MLTTLDAMIEKLSPKMRRGLGLAFMLTIFGAGVGLILHALQDNIVYFYGPSDLPRELAAQQPIRVGGLVLEGTVRRQEEHILFDVGDGVAEITILYDGVLPDLFREGQGIIAQGSLIDGVFHADTILAKHDETYMPKEVADLLKEKGLWQEP